MSASIGLRFNEIDLMRGFACVVVVLYHYVSRSPQVGWMNGIELPVLGAVARYGYLGVHLFFVISGFVILMSARSATPQEFIAARAARLLPALWVAASVTALTAWITSDVRFMVSIQNYLINLTMVPHWFKVPYVDGAYWSLAYELHFYIYVWLALRFGLMARIDWLLAAWLLVSTINAARPMWPAEFWLTAKWAPFFAAGALFYLVRTDGVRPQRVALLVVCYALAMVYSMRDATASRSVIDGLTGPDAAQVMIVGGIVSLIFGVFTLVARGAWTMEASALTAVSGALTYPLYLIHQYFGAMVYGRLLDLLGTPLIALAMTLFVVLAVAFAIHRLVERRAGPALRRWLAPRPQLSRNSC